MILDKIKDRIGYYDGSIGICYIDLESGNSCSAGNCDVFPASGIVKLLILVEAFRRIEEGSLKKDDKYILQKEDYSCTDEDGMKSYGALEHMHIGTELTIEDLYKLNVTVSDNMAFNILLKMFTAEEVNRTMRRFGFQNTKINRAIFDKDKIAKGIDNYVSVQEMADLFVRMEKGQIVSNKASKEMLHILCHHQKMNVLPYYFEESLRIAHQTGYDDTLILDMGIVYAPHPFVLCMASSAADTRNAESIMRDITLMCYKNSQLIHSKKI